MSYTFTFSGESSELTSTFHPAIELDPNNKYVIGLINFESYNSIPNIDEKNNYFYFGDLYVNIPTGTYQLEDINKYLRGKLRSNETKGKDPPITLTANNNTLQCSLYSTKSVDFTKENTIRELLGFESKIYDANKTHISEKPVNIIKVNAVCVECNIVTGSYNNSKPVHIIHEFFPNVAAGVKIVEIPTNVIYLPINTSTIDKLTVKILDQDGNLINLRGETITVRLHIKKE